MEGLNLFSGMGNSPKRYVPAHHSLSDKDNQVGPGRTPSKRGGLPAQLDLKVTNKPKKGMHASLMHQQTRAPFEAIGLGAGACLFPPVPEFDSNCLDTLLLCSGSSLHVPSTHLSLDGASVPRA